MIISVAVALTTVAAVAAAAGLGTPASPRSPPVAEPMPMTPVQVASMQRLQSSAQAASNAATDATLAMLADAAFVSMLTQKLGGAAAAAALGINVSNPRDLLQRHAAELAVTEIVHAFPAAYNPHQNNALDMDVGMARNASWFYNQWQMPVLFPERETQARLEVIMYLAPSAATEVGLWGLEPFTADVPANIGPPDLWPGGYPANLKEANNRAVYGMFNQQKLDNPGFYWGDTVVVFNNSAVSNMTLLQPVDTGDYVSDCDLEFTDAVCGAFQGDRTSCKFMWYCQYFPANGSCLTRPSTPPKNCSSWGFDHAVGTLTHNVHLLGAFATWETDALWRSRLSDLLARMLPREGTPLCQIPNMTIPQFDFYYEANLLGNPNFHGGFVKFVIASVPQLFGNDAWGSQVRQWCIERGWALVWSLGPNPGPSDKRLFPPSWAADKRVLDPAVLQSSTAAGNISQTRLSQAAKVFDRVWTTAAATRAGNITNLQATALEWWTALVDNPGHADDLNWLRTRPLSSDSCAKPHDCIGTAAVGDSGDTSRRCVCYHAAP